MNFYEILSQHPQTAFNTVQKLNSMLIGASNISGPWPFEGFSKHPDPEIVIVLEGSVDIEYDDGEIVNRSAGEVEEMKGNRGHKVHQSGPKSAQVLLIFPRNKR